MHSARNQQEKEQERQDGVNNVFSIIIGMQNQVRQAGLCPAVQHATNKSNEMVIYSFCM